MTLEVSHSSCSIARTCPMKYKWRYVDGYKPIRKSAALTLGSVVHEAFDYHYRNLPVRNYIIKQMDEQIADAGLPDVEDLEIVKYTALSMWDNYPFKHLKDQEFEEVKSEREFRIPIDDMHNVVFVGKSDRLIKIGGKWWVGELKTSGLHYQAFKNIMSVSDQVTAYVYAWKKLGVPVEGVIFDFIKKPLLRKGANETYREYCDRIQKDYQDRAKFYFNRHYEYRSDEDVKRWVTDIRYTINLVRDIWKGLAYRNPDSCWKFNAECPYKKICFSDHPDPLTIELYFEQKGRKVNGPIFGANQRLA